MLVHEPYNPNKFKINKIHIKLLRELWLAIESGNTKLIKVLKAEISKFSDHYSNGRPKLVMPYPKLPNVSSFKIKSLSKYHPILKLGKILKRMGKPIHKAVHGSNDPSPTGRIDI